MLADSGNFSDNPTPAGEVKSRLLLQGMGRLGYAAANVAERDLKAGFDALVERAAAAGFPLISANIVRRDTGEAVFPSHVLTHAVSADGRNELRVGLIGCARYNPNFRRPGPGGAELAILRPLEPVRKAVAELQAEGADLIVLLASLHREDARRLVAGLPGIEFVIGSYGGFAGTLEDRPSGSWLLYSGNQGKRLGETRVFLGGEEGRPKPTHRLHYLTAVYPDEPGMREFLSQAGGDVARERAAAAGERKPLVDSYLGSGGCRSCHAQAHAQWAGTAHATALDTLEREGKERNPACLACHVTGAGKPGGYRGREESPDLAGVGCEACHGPGAAHARQPASGYGPVKTATCTGCHDLENSPEFDYYSYRTRIVHGGGAAGE